MNAKSWKSIASLGLGTGILLATLSCGNKTSFGTVKASNKPPSPAQGSSNEKNANGVLVGSKDTPANSNSNPQTPDSGELGGVFKTLRVSVPGGRLGSEATVSVEWDVENKARFDKIRLYWRKQNGEWIEIKDFVEKPNGFDFVYGNRDIGPFEIKAVGIQKNASLQPSEVQSLWLPNIFQSAILTRSVQCLFCHISVEGDVGGIEFPKEMHEWSGTGLTISGRLYSTNEIPNLLKSRAKGGDFENYKNGQKHIFPANLMFPTLDASLIQSKVSGSVSGGNIFSYVDKKSVAMTSIVKFFKGNVFLDGKNAPLVLAGEIFVDGDVVIRGKYKGIGTIYARNVYIVDDVVANSSPFPFPLIEAEAEAKAKSEISKGSDALFIASIQDVLVGDPVHKLTDDSSRNPFPGVKTSTPFSWMPRDVYISLGSKPLVKKDFKMLDGSPAQWDPGTSDFPIDVSRVDAYIYAGQAFVWRSFANSLLNGGYMSPNSAVLSKVESLTGSTWTCGGKHDGPSQIPDACGARPPLVNPRNSLPTHTNVIRFDYRLSVGIPGMETLKEFF